MNDDPTTSDDEWCEATLEQVTGEDSWRLRCSMYADVPDVIATGAQWTRSIVSRGAVRFKRSDAERTMRDIIVSLVKGHPVDGPALAAKVAACLASSVPTGEEVAEARDFMAAVRVEIEDRHNLQLVTSVCPMGVESWLYEVPANGDREVASITVGLAMLNGMNDEQARRVLDYLRARYPDPVDDDA